MKLEGSCHCGAVSFQVNSRTPYPFNYCYCSICRKTAGGGGFAINLMADTPSLQVKGSSNLAIYQATIDGKTSTAMRHFCRQCGSHLWLWDPRWPDLIHPLASAIDTELPRGAGAGPSHARIQSQLVHCAGVIRHGSSF